MFTTLNDDYHNHNSFNFNTEFISDSKTLFNFLHLSSYLFVLRYTYGHRVFFVMFRLKYMSLSFKLSYFFKQQPLGIRGYIKSTFEEATQFCHLRCCAAMLIFFYSNKFYIFFTKNLKYQIFCLEFATKLWLIGQNEDAEGVTIIRLSEKVEHYSNRLGEDRQDNYYSKVLFMDCRLESQVQFAM